MVRNFYILLLGYFSTRIIIFSLTLSGLCLSCHNVLNYNSRNNPLPVKIKISFFIIFGWNYPLMRCSNVVKFYAEIYWWKFTVVVMQYLQKRLLLKIYYFRKISVLFFIVSFSFQKQYAIAFTVHKSDFSIHSAWTRIIGFLVSIFPHVNIFCY